MLHFPVGRYHRIPVAVAFLVAAGFVGADQAELARIEQLAGDSPQQAAVQLEALDDRQLSDGERLHKARLMCEAYQDTGDAAKALLVTDRLAGLSAASREEAALLLCRAKARQRLGQVREAARDLADARQAAVGMDDQAMVVRIMLQQGDLQMLQGQHDQAFAVLYEAYEQVDAAGQPRLKHDVLNSLATVYYNTGRLDLAEKYYRELVAVAEAGDDKTALAITLFNLGHVFASQQRFAEADDAFERSLKISHEVHDQLGAAFTLKAWAESAQVQQDLPLAKSRLEAALAIFEQAGDFQQTASTRRHLGDLARAQHRPEEAIEHYLKALPILERHNFQTALVRTYRGLSEAYADLGDHDRAYTIHKAYTLLLKEDLEKQSQESMQRLQAQFETQRLAADNEKLEHENTRQKQQLAYEHQRLVGLVIVVVLVLIVLALIMILWRRGRQHARNMEQLATQDELTRLKNRRAILETGQAELQRATRFDRPFSCLLMDIDHFKSINDTYGHAVGDEVLIQVAAQIKATLRRMDAVGRFGGEEFLVIAAESDLSQATALAERIRHAVEAGSYDAMPGRKVTLSIGVAQYAQEHSLQQVIEHADQRLYQAKGQGRNRVVSGT